MTFNPLQAMVMTFSQAVGQGQRSVSSKDRVEINVQTDRRTDGGDCITSLANAVSNNDCLLHLRVQLAQLSDDNITWKNNS